MKLTVSIALVLLVVAAGCKRPGPVELRTDAPVPTVEIANVIIDTSATQSSIDTTALLPDDEENFLGRFILNKVTYDVGTQPKRTEIFTTAELTLKRPYMPSDSEDEHEHAYYGLPLGTVYLNDSLLIPVPHYLVYRTSTGDKVVPYGFEYRRRFEKDPDPNAVYRWRAIADSVASFDIAVTMPDNITVQSPSGGTDISREKDLLMRWTGQGDLLIVVSTVNLKGEIRPVMKLRPQSNTGAAILGAKIMRILPRDQNFVFTFVLANRNIATTIGRYPARVLAQAACVYNSYVRLH